MPWTVEYASERGLVVVTGAGEMKNEDATAQATEAMCYVKQNHSNAVLVDYSGAVSEVSLPTLYWLPDYFSELGAPWNMRVAVLLPRAQYRLESFQFFELVCKNAGYHVRLFETKAAAETWLGELQARPESTRQALPA